MPQTVLYIEDDPASRVLVERALSFAGYRVLMAERALEGIDIARRELPDLILTDINLPDMSGREITTMLRADPRFNRIPIVALTALGHDSSQQAMTMAAGVNGYLAKPVDVETLGEKISYYLGGGRDKVDPTQLGEAQTRYTQEVVARLEKQVRELEATNEALKRLDSMKDSFIQVTAHELRTPLTLVYGYSRLLADLPALKTDPNPQVAFILKGFEDGIRRMQTIVNEILTVNRLMTHRLEIIVNPLRPAQLVEKALAAIQEAAPKRQVNIVFEPADWPPRVQGDGDLLVLLLTHLIGNAIKFTPDGGSVFVTAKEEGDKLRLSVRDTGVGVSPENRTTIFERFHVGGDPGLHSTSKFGFRGGGLGLGLAVCKTVVEAHHGTISVESPGFDAEKCPGAEFIVLLPLKQL